MKKIIVAMIVLLAEAVGFAGDSMPFLLDTVTTSRAPAVGPLSIFWDASWIGGNANATVVIKDNGIEVKRATGAGEFMHTLTSLGRNELTYTTYINGVAQAEVYSVAVYAQSNVVSFAANGGNVGEPTRWVVKGSAIGTLPTPTGTGCSFAGWWTSANGGTQISASTKVTGNVTYYAHWTVNQYTVTFDANGGTGGWSKKQKYGSAIVAPTVTREWCTFVGWQPAVAATVPADNVTYTAQWARWGDRISASKMGGNTMEQLYPSDYGRMTTVVLEDGITELPAEFFDGCDNVEFVTWPSTLVVLSKDDLPKKIRATLSYDKKGFMIYNGWILDYEDRSASEVTIPDSVTGIGMEAFSGCSGLKSVTIPNSMTSIGARAFEGCSGLTSVTIPNSVTNIGTRAFNGCSGLASVTIGNGVMSIGTEAFSSCSGVRDVIVSQYVLDRGLNHVFSSAYSVITNVSYSLNVTNIGSCAFFGCSGLTSVTIPISVTSIGGRAFEGCSGLTSVYISDLARWCGISFGTDQANPLYYAHDLYFNGTKITDLNIPDGVTSIGNCAFYGCSGLTNVKIPNGVTSIGARAFEGCSGLTSAKIPNGVTSIGYMAFYGCSGLTSVTIPGSVTSIGVGAFYGCSGLTSVTIPGSVTSIGAGAFEGCSGLTSVHITDLARWCGISFDTDQANPLYYAHDLYLNGTRITDLNIPDGVTSIGEGAFYGCSGLTSATIPNGVTSIGARAFEGCSGLTSVTIPNGVTSIGEGAFSGCSGLTSVTIPDGVTSIGEGAFSGCSDSLFDTTTIPDVVLVDGWAVGCTRSELDDTGLLSGDLNLTGIRGIGAGAFEGCVRLKSVKIPNGVTGIGNYAFYGCSGLTSVTIPDSVTSIGARAFEYCSDSLFDTTTVPGVKLVDGWVVGYTVSLSGDLNLTGMRGIGASTFEGCGGLTSVTIPSSVTSIGDGTFHGCRGLTSVKMPDSVTSIGDSAFSGCWGLKGVKMPDSVTSIGDSAFYGCRGLTNVTFGGDAPKVGSLVFDKVNSNCTVYVHRNSSGWGVSIPGAWNGIRIEYIYTVTFEPNGGSLGAASPTMFVENGASVGTLPTPTRTGYKFNGWYTAATGGTKVSATTKVTKSVTYYAQWTKDGSAVVSGPGTVSVVSARSVQAGKVLAVTLRRADGNKGRIAVKYKSQTSTGICGKDFDYVKDVLVWADGEGGDKTFNVPTHYIAYTTYPIALRVKLSTLTQGAYLGCVTPKLAESKVYFDMVDNWNPGEIVATAPNPLSTRAGNVLRMTLSRRSGSDGRISVKYKTQTSTGICGVNGSADFDYVKDILVWEAGDASDRVIEIPTYRKPNRPYPLMLRVKLAPLATGANLGNVVPRFRQTKIYADITE